MTWKLLGEQRVNEHFRLPFLLNTTALAKRIRNVQLRLLPPDDYALDERTPWRYRNPFLIEAMTELNLIDQMGYGIHRMVQDQIRRFLPLPDYDLSTAGEIKLTIPGAVTDESYSQLLKLLMVRTDLPLEDVLALDRVRHLLLITHNAHSHKDVTYRPRGGPKVGSEAHHLDMPAKCS